MQKLHKGCPYPHSISIFSGLVQLIDLVPKYLLKGDWKSKFLSSFVFSHLRLHNVNTISTSYCLWILVKQIVTRLNKHSSLQGVFAILKSLFENHIPNVEMLILIKLSSVLKTRIKYWNLYWNIGCGILKRTTQLPNVRWILMLNGRLLSERAHGWIELQ